MTERDVGGGLGQGLGATVPREMGRRWAGLPELCTAGPARWVGPSAGGTGHGARLCGSPLCGKGRAWQEGEEGQSRQEKVETGFKSSSRPAGSVLAQSKKSLPV